MCVRMLMLVQLLGGADADGELLRRAARLPARRGRLDPGPGVADHGDLDLPDHLVSPPALRHVWLLVGVVGCAGCLWWMSSVDNFTQQGAGGPDDRLLGAVCRAVPSRLPARRSRRAGSPGLLYGGALAVVFLVVPIVVIPTMTSTIVSAWTDRAADAQRLNLPQNRPEVEAASARIADYYRQRGVLGLALSQAASTVLGKRVEGDAISEGIQAGLRF